MNALLVTSRRHLCRSAILVLGCFVGPASGQGVPAEADRIEMTFDESIAIVEDKRGQGAQITVDGKPTGARRSRKGEAPLGNFPFLGEPAILFEGGTTSQRWARIVDDPKGQRGRVLEFGIAEPNVKRPERGDSKSRVQLKVNENKNVRELYVSTWLLLDDRLSALKLYPGLIKWLTLSEWWNNAGWTEEDYVFRVSVGIRKVKMGGVEALYFGADSTAKSREKSKWDSLVWERVNSSFPVPIGRWMRIEYLFTEGNGVTGRFVMAVTPQGDEREVIIDITAFTHHPQDPQPNGVSHLNPMKLYTSDELTNYMRSQGYPLKVYWDHLYILACGAAVPSLPSECVKKFSR